MGKLGIIGQIGLGLLMPGIGAMFGKFAGALIGTGGTVATAAGNFINAALNIGTKVGNVFSSITKGVTNVVGEVVGAAADQLGLANPIKNFTGSLGINKGNGWDVSGKGFNSVMQTVSDAGTDLLSKGQDLFSMDTLTGKHESVSKYLKAKRDALVPDLPNVSAEMDSVTNEFTGKLIETPTADVGVPEVSTTNAKVTDVATKPKSLLTKAIEDPLGSARQGAEYVFEKGVTKTGEAFTEALPTVITTAAQKAGGAYPDIVSNTTYGAVASMPTPTSIGSGDYAGDINLNAYMDNTNYMNASPYGHTAAIYNYGQSMRGVG